MAIHFEDNSIEVTNAIKGKAIKFLHETSGEVVSRTVKKSRVRTGQTTGAWDYITDERELKSTIGNPLINAIYEEFGTGEYALKGNGRKGGWIYKDKVTGKFYRTYGKTPTRAFHYAYKELELTIQAKANQIFRELN